MWGTRRTAAVLLLAAMALPGMARAQSGEILGEGDSIRITVFQNPDLTTETRISERGTITFPLIGEVALSGLTPARAETRIAEQLTRGKFLVKPQVTVNVVQVRSRQVSVLGQVARPGRYALDDTSSSLTDILALAGGVAPGGDDNVTVTMNRDVLYVQRAPVFYIYGEVQRAGSYRLEQGMTVMQALSVGGGVTPRGTDRGLKIRRRGQDGSLHAIDARLTDLVQANDVIYVRESWF